MTSLPDRRHPMLPLAGWLIGPTAWGLDLAVRYALVPWACGGGGRWAMATVSLLAAAACVAGIAISLWHLRAVRQAGASASVGAGGDRLADGAYDRAVVLSLAGMALSAISLVGVGLGALPLALLGGC